MQKAYWRRALKHTANKYLGWDWRVIPLLGFVGSIISIIIVKDIWAKLLIGYAPILIFSVFFALAQRDIWKEDVGRLKPIWELVESRKQDIGRFVFPYMCDFNAYRVVRGSDNVLDLRIYFPNSLLTDEIELKLKCRLIIDGNGCLAVQMGRVKLFRDSVNCVSLPYSISDNKAAVEAIKKAVTQYKPINVVLEIWDEDNERIRWQTPTWSVLPFA